MRAGVPVIPIAVVGAEESMPILFKIPALSKALGLPYAPITANMLLLGPLGVVGYFPAKFKLRVLDPVSFDDVEPDQIDLRWRSMSYNASWIVSRMDSEWSMILLFE